MRQKGWTNDCKVPKRWRGVPVLVQKRMEGEKSGIGCEVRAKDALGVVVVGGAGQPALGEYDRSEAVAEE